MNRCWYQFGRLFKLMLGVVYTLAGWTLQAEEITSVENSGPATITISENASVVRESFSAELKSTNSTVLFSGLPVEADPASMMIMDRHGELKLMDWQVPPRKRSPGMRSEETGKSVQIMFEPEIPPLPGTIQATMQCMVPGQKKFDLVYVMTGLVWQASYDVLIRGDLADIGSPMSIDVEGWIEISNASSRTFNKAAISVIGADSLGETPPVKQPGILELDENSPLSDLWRYFPPEPKTPHIYIIEPAVTLPSGQAVFISYVSVTRKPVERILIFRAEEIPTDTRSHGVEASQFIRFKNAADYGGNRSVPPGPALIYLGSQRSALHQKAWFKHTPSQGEIRIDMGKLSGVVARRIDRGRVAMVGGGYEQVFEVRIENQLDQPVTPILDELPPITLAWSVLKANQKFDRYDRRLIFQPTIPPKSSIIIQYTLRVTIPET